MEGRARLTFMLINEFVYGTTNAGKLLEVQNLAAGLGVKLLGLGDLVDQKRISRIPDAPEVYSSYQRNAALKAKIYANWSGRACFADDAGIEIECLGGLPGVYTARFGIARMLHMLGSSDNLRARLVCCVAYAEPLGRLVSVTSSIDGVVMLSLLPKSQGDSLPFSHLFFPHGKSISLANLTKRSEFVSHRGTAFIKLMRALF
jgi:XTP/dITP diphosphohydrolase